MWLSPRRSLLLGLSVTKDEHMTDADSRLPAMVTSLQHCNSQACCRKTLLNTGGSLLSQESSAAQDVLTVTRMCQNLHLISLPTQVVPYT